MSRKPNDKLAKANAANTPKRNRKAEPKAESQLAVVDVPQQTAHARDAARAKMVEWAIARHSKPALSFDRATGHAIDAAIERLAADKPLKNAVAAVQADLAAQFGDVGVTDGRIASHIRFYTAEASKRKTARFAVDGNGTLTLLVKAAPRLQKQS